MDVPEFRMERFTIQLQAVEMHLQNPKTGFCLKAEICVLFSLFFCCCFFLSERRHDSRTAVEGRG